MCAMLDKEPGAVQCWLLPLRVHVCLLVATTSLMPKRALKCICTVESPSLAAMKDKLDQLIDDFELLPLYRDADGYIIFEQFLRIFEISSNYSKSEFAEKKKEFITERRKAFKNDKENYR